MIEDISMSINTTGTYKDSHVVYDVVALSYMNQIKTYLIPIGFYHCIFPYRCFASHLSVKTKLETLGLLVLSRIVPYHANIPRNKSPHYSQKSPDRKTSKISGKGRNEPRQKQCAQPQAV